MFKFDLQLFAELDIPGISEDTLKELEAEVQETQETTESVEPAEPQQVEDSPVEADNVNKPVENEDEFEDVKEGQTIPYDRFKSVNDRRKNAESRIKELEEQLAKAQQNIANPAPSNNVGVEETPKPQQQQVEETESEYTDEQEKRIYEMAAKRVAQKRNMSEEDIEALEYSDDATAKMRYQNALINEVNLVKQEIVQYKAQEQAFKTMTDTCNQEFDAISKKFNSYPDAQERWNYISQERFNKLPQRKQAVINEAFSRLQAKKGTYADIEIVSDYFDLANEEWNKAHSTAVNNTPKPVSNKYAQVQKLPKSGNIGGSGAADSDMMNAERLAEILNEPNGWEKLSPEQQARILSGSF